MEQRSVVIVAAKRTPIGEFMGAFAEVPAVDLGVAAARAALDAAGLDPGEVQETVAGHGRQAERAHREVVGALPGKAGFQDHQQATEPRLVEQPAGQLFGVDVSGSHPLAVG